MAHLHVDVTWLIHICYPWDMTRSHMCNMTHSNMRHDAFTCIHDSFILATREKWQDRACATWLIQTWDVAHSHVHVPWLIHIGYSRNITRPRMCSTTRAFACICDVTHSYWLPERQNKIAHVCSQWRAPCQNVSKVSSMVMLYRQFRSQQTFENFH